MNFLKKIFSFNIGDKNNKINNQKYEDKTKLSTKTTDLKEMLTIEINKSVYIKDKFKNSLIEDFNMLNNIDFGDEFLTLAEKKDLNLNGRSKISKKIIPYLTDSGLHYESNPQNIIEHLLLSAKTKVNANKMIEKEVKMNNTHFIFVIANGERDCEWCKSFNRKKIPLSTDIVALLNDNCKCEYSRCIIRPYIDLSQYGLEDQ